MMNNRQTIKESFPLESCAETKMWTAAHNLELDKIMRSVQHMDNEREDLLDMAINREEWRNCTGTV